MTHELTHQHDATVGIICHHVLTRKRAVNLIMHLPDDTWDFMCGEEDGHDEADDASVICAGCAFEGFVTGVSLEDVSIGYVAERPDAEKRWVIRPMTAEEFLELEEE